MIDLHVHSYYSVDAESSPRAMIDAAVLAGVRVLSITDHNCVEHIEPALGAAEGRPLRLVPGLELTCSFAEFGLNEIHILAHFDAVDDVGWRRPALTGLIETIKTAQSQNLIRLLDGLGISIERLERVRQNLLLSNRLAPTTQPALHLFKRCQDELRPLPWSVMKLRRDSLIYELSKGGEWLSFPEVEHAIRILALVGAKTTLAHPGRYGLATDALSTLIDRLVAAGLQGLEAIYFPQQKSSSTFILMAQAKKCLITSGSDSHSADSMRHPAYSQFIASITVSAQTSGAVVGGVDNL